MQKNDFLIVGLPQSGKTTFLAALSHVILSRDLPDSLQYDGLVDKREYIRHIRDQWLSAEKIVRTTLGTEETVVLKAKTPDNSMRMELNIPDFFGETYRDQWEKRQATRLFDNVAKEATGAIFLIHSQKIKNPVNIGQKQAVLRAISAIESPKSYYETPANAPETEAPTDAKPDSKIIVDVPKVETEPWSPSGAPSQVIFIDLLQTLISYGISKVAIVISAWDAVSSTNEPIVWVENNMQLLHQFLLANSYELQVKIYGVSAQGGNYDKPEEKQVLIDTDPASDRVIVNDDGNISHDITLPLKWLMGL